MKIVVTGANGYIGSHVVKKLLDRGHGVIAVDFDNVKIDSRAIFDNTDIFDEGLNFFEKWENPDAVIHLAWQDGFIHNAFSHIENLYKHFSFLRQLIDNGLKQLIVMGSMHEIGYYKGAIKELTACNPTSFYAIAKNTLRQALEIYIKDKELAFQWLRAFYIVGDDYQNNSIFTKILQMNDKGQLSFPFTDGKNEYDFQSIEDLSKQIACVVEQREIEGIINCCSGTPISIKDKVEEFLIENDLKIKPDFGKYPSRPYDSPCIYGDNTKIKLIMEKNNAS